MSPQYTVSATPDAEEEGGVALAVASLPATFGPAASQAEAQVFAIHGSAGWAAQAIQAIDGGARGIVVVHPVPEETAALKDAAQAAGVPVVLDQRWAANPALVSRAGETDARDAVRTSSGQAAMLDSVATAAPGTDPDHLLADHLATVLQLAGHIDGLRVLRKDAHGYTATGCLSNGAPLALQGVLTASRPAGVGFQLYTFDGGVSGTIPDPDAAWPAEVRVTGPQGEVLLPTLFESAHRASWRRLKDHLDAGTVSSDLAWFAQLTETLS